MLKNKVEKYLKKREKQRKEELFQISFIAQFLLITVDILKMLIKK